MVKNEDYLYIAVVVICNCVMVALSNVEIKSGDEEEALEDGLVHGLSSSSGVAGYCLRKKPKHTLQYAHIHHSVRGTALIVWLYHTHDHQHPLC